jgi:predicted unusual protein kinase regulating ubiquinone biosynthesis (AarF/ABC1/UbiB family)
MRLPAFIPDELRQLARFVPLSGWDAIEWKPMLGSMRSVSWRFVTGSGVDKLSSITEDVVPSVTFVDALDDADSFSDIVEQPRLQEIGDNILRLYFAQWLVDDGLFLDLRASRFGVDDDELLYAPNGLWIKLRPDFREGMLALYRSFYSADDTAFEDALRQMGLLHPDLSATAESELKDLLHSHFGIEQSAQRFSIDTFKSSFDDLFEFFIANDYKLHSDFVWVGFYLITLYLTLEQTNQAHDVRLICSELLLD